jgi:hypothetical protein
MPAGKVRTASGLGVAPATRGAFISRGVRSAEMPKRARVAVLGCGHWGSNIIRNLSQLEA